VADPGFWIRGGQISEIQAKASNTFKSSQVFVYCVKCQRETDYILIIAVTDASMIYRERI